MSGWDNDAQMYGCALAFVYCRETDRFLIELRGKDVRYSGTWGLFGGAVQANESPGQAAARELYEETHYDAKPVRVFTMSVDPRLFCGIFVVPAEFKPRLSKESKSYAWVASFDDIHQMQPDFQRQRRTFERVLSALRNNVRVPKRVLDPNMAAWFHGSVVVDLHGDPLKMYHGTHFDFSAFDLQYVGHGHDQEGSGFYFTSNPDVASGYQNVPEGMSPNAGPNVMPVYLSIKKPVGNKPLTASQIGKIILAGDPEALYNFGDVAWEGRARVLRQAIDTYMEYDNPRPQIFALNNDFYQNESGKFLTVLKQVTGYDGIIAQHSHNTIAIVFSPTQIKSVFNSGRWDKRNPNITASISSTFALDLISSVTATVEPGSRIEDRMRKYGLDPAKATIRNGIIVEYRGDVVLDDRTSHRDRFEYANITKIPFRFEKVTGNFVCSFMELTTLTGSPKEVGGSFYCQSNNLTSLQGGPEQVGKNFYCYDNRIVTLVGGPNAVGGDFNCAANRLVSLEGCPEQVGGDFYCAANPGSASFKKPKCAHRVFRK